MADHYGDQLMADLRDVKRYRWLREQVKTPEKMVLAQALFWNNSSRGEFDKAVDQAMFAEADER